MGALGLILDALGAAASAVAGWPEDRSCTPAFALQHARDAGALRRAIAAHADAVATDDALLGRARLAASRVLRVQVLRAASQARTAARAARERAQALLRARHRAWSVLGAAELATERANALSTAADALAAFVALHDATARAIQAALPQSYTATGTNTGTSQLAPELPILIVNACRQATALLSAVHSPTVITLAERAADACRAAAAEMPSDDRDPNAPVLLARSDAAAPLGQFLRRDDTNDHPASPPPPLRMSQADVRLTLESIRAELAEGRSLVALVDNAILNDSTVGLGGALRRAPVWYAEMAVGACVATHAVATRSRFLGGSGKLEDGIISGASFMRGFMLNNVLEPCTRLYGQVFRSAPSSGASLQSVEVQREALRDMLTDYTNAYLQNVPDAKQLAMKGDTSAVMDDYVKQVRTPGSSLLFGNLAQTMLVQVQKLKADVEELVVNAKLTLQAQELNLALVAVVPALATLALSAFIVSEVSKRFRRGRARAVVVSPEQTLAFMLGDVHIALVALKHSRQQDHDTYHALIRVGHLALAVHDAKSFVEDGGVRAPRKVIHSFCSEMDLLVAEHSVDAAILHLHRVWASFPGMLPGAAHAIAALL